MTYVTYSSRSTIWQRVFDLSVRWAERRTQHRVYRETLKELSALSSAELLDVGIDRADIDSIAEQVAYRT